MHISRAPHPAPPHAATRWLLAAAWASVVVLAALPWIADLVDPLQPLQAPASTDALAVSLFILDASTRGLQRMWVIATTFGLIATTLCPVLTVVWLNRQMRPMGRLLRVTCAPLLALLVAIAVNVVMDVAT